MSPRRTLRSLCCCLTLSTASCQSGGAPPGDGVAVTPAPAAAPAAVPDAPLPATGTWLTLDIRPGGKSSYPDDLVALGAKVVFTADSGAARSQLWVSDGTRSGTAQVKAIQKEGHLVLTSRAALGDRLVFTFAGGESEPTGAEPWISDATEAGTDVLRDIAPGAAGSFPEELTTAGRRVFFVADDRVHGRELWVSDGTREGTRLVKNIVANDVPFAPAGSAIEVTSKHAPDDPRLAIVDELRRREGQQPTYGAKPHDLFAAGERVYFELSAPQRPDQLWSSDGTEEGTGVVVDAVGIVTPAGALDGVAYFFDRADRLLLRRSAGTKAKTSVVMDFGPAYGDPSVRVAASPGVVFRGALWFVLSVDHDDEKERGAKRWAGLWRTNGTKAGTVRISPEPARHLTVLADTLYFSSFRGLWRTDGTTGDTVRIKEFADGISIATNGTALFIDDGERDIGWRLWRSDGTDGGTELLGEFAKDPRPSGHAFAVPRPAVAAGGLVFFQASKSGEDMELWAAR